MIVTFTVLKPVYTRRIKLVFWLVVLMVVVAVAAMIINTNTMWIVAGVIGFPCMLVSAQLPALREEPYGYLDKKIVFDSHNITIGDGVFEIALLENLTLCLREYDGLELGRKTISTMNGTNNFVSFRLGQDEYEYAFYIDSEMQLNDFKGVFEQWYIQKFRFSEFNRADERTFLFEPLDYLQRHHFEKKYGINPPVL